VYGLEDELEAGNEYDISVLVRNNGWDVWTPEKGENGIYELRVTWVRADEWKPDNSLDDSEFVRAGLPGPVEPGQCFEVEMSITTPKEPGKYMMVVDMANNRTGWFRQSNYNVPFEKEITIK
jgi:hypothetical protein